LRNYNVLEVEARIEYCQSREWDFSRKPYAEAFITIRSAIESCKFGGTTRVLIKQAVFGLFTFQLLHVLSQNDVHRKLLAL